jgi:hypothetical protein
VCHGCPIDGDIQSYDSIAFPAARIPTRQPRISVDEQINRAREIVQDRPSGELDQIVMELYANPASTAEEAGGRAGVALRAGRALDRPLPGAEHNFAAPP